MSIELKDEWVEKALAAYEDSLAADPFHSAKTAIRANLTAILPLIEAEVREQCAKIIDGNVEGSTANGNKRVLIPRNPGNLAGSGYAQAIRGGGNE